MPRKKWINRNDPATQTFQLLYRSQDDPLLHSEGEDRALFPISNKNQSSQNQYAPSVKASASSDAEYAAAKAEARGLHLADLEDANEVDLDSMRDNEGEAAEHGVYFDDSQYDYMQHLRGIGEGGGESHFIEASDRTKGKVKAKGVRLEDALRGLDLDQEDSERALDDGFSTFSRSARQRTYQDQQDVPDEIAGFQPDMDPRLREVLEALDDDAYVDDADLDDVFGELGKVGKQEGEIDLDEFEAYLEDDDGWESDVTEKAVLQQQQQPKELKIKGDVSAGPGSNDAGQDESSSGLPHDVAAIAAAEDGDWLRDFAKYKRDVASSKKVLPKPDASVVAPSALNDAAPSLYTLNGTPLRQKKRKGALTNPSAYSMTSSSLARTDGLQLLDARFDQFEKMYALDETDEFDEMDGGMSMISGLTGKSKMSTLSTTSFADEGAVRGDLDGMMDDFLGDWNKANPGGKRKGAKGKRGKNGNEKHGIAQLEEIRSGLGRGRLLQKPQKA